jgi:pilus assembly protein CpaB
MNITRIAILGVAALAAGGAALLARGILGGGAPDVQAEVPEPQFEIIHVLVAAENVEPGRTLTVDSVRWEEWPDTNASDELITRDAYPEMKDFIEGAVSRAPLIGGEPITENKIVHADSGSFMSATLVDGMRAVSIPISAESGAGGFILPNDRVDVILTREMNDQDITVFESNTILDDVRVLAIDQVIRQEDDQEFVVANTATLELRPNQSVLLARAQAAGELSLALRGLGDATVSDRSSLGQGASVTVLRYGVSRSGERNIIVGSGIQ